MENTSTGEKVQLSTCDSEKDLGVLVDDQLSFEKHIAEKVSKANQNVGIIRRTFTFLDEEIFLLLYSSHVRPHLEYANPVWSPYKIKDIESIEKVQRRATKQIPSLKSLSYEDRLKKLNLFSLAYRRLRGDMIEAYKILSGKYDEDASPDLRPLDLQTRPATMGNSRRIEVRRAEGGHNICHHFYTIRVARVWNKLPDEVVMAPTIDCFKRRLDVFWRDHPLKWDYRQQPDNF